MLRKIAPIALAALMGVAACDAEVGEVPEVAEVETEVGGEVELIEELILGMDDVGDTLVATGWVSGVPLANSFYLRTEGNRVIFVESDATVAAGQSVRVSGPLAATTVSVFEGWESEAFESGFEAAWDVERALHIDANMVTSL